MRIGLAMSVAGLTVTLAVGALGVRRALEVRGQAQRSLDDSSRAAQAAMHAADRAAGEGGSAAGTAEAARAEPAEPPRPQGGFGDGMAAPDLSRGETLAPRAAKVDRASGEQVAPFVGFGVSVESSPSGARVLAGGVEVGETPIVATVRCAPGEAVEVRVEARGFRPWRRSVRCRADALVSVQAKLAR